LGEGGLREKFTDNIAAIRLLHQLERENRSATGEERRILVRYVGWGGLPQVFSTATETPKWAAEQETLRELLSRDEYQGARSTVLNAHYTPEAVVRSMWSAVRHLGFRGGRILEPACGVGHFFGLMPDDMRGESSLCGVEIDPLTARLARHLYPEADIRAQPFEETVLPANGFDLAISNVPFGDYAPFDPKLNSRRFAIHDYFFVATVERVRPGGLIAFITSRGTIDKPQPTVRETLAKSCDLLGAVRLPHTTFARNANTHVTTDMVFLRKRLPGEDASGHAWRDSRPAPDFPTEQGVFLNEYFHAHPEMMLGRLELVARGLHGREEIRLAPDNQDLTTALITALSTLPTAVYRPLTDAETAAVRVTLPVPAGVKPNAYVLTGEAGGTLAVRSGDELRLLTNLSPALARRMRRLICVRDAARDCLQAQVDDRPEPEIESTRQRLNQEYDQFVGQFGPVSRAGNLRALAGDPDLPLLLSLETYDEHTNTATKTALFRERTVQRRRPVESASDAKEALVVTLNETGRVDLDHMARLLGRSPESFLPELSGALFHNPSSRRWETEDEYLSGDVRRKLELAIAAAETDQRFRPNVEALRTVQPPELKATEIDARLGSAWIPADDVTAFGQELLRAHGANDVRVHHVAELGLWSVEVSYYAKTGVANRSEWGTERVAAHELLEHALNLRTPTVYDYFDDQPVVNPTATEAARDKQQKIRDRFAEWIWSDDSRRERLVALYNSTYNCTRLRTFNGDHLQLPGANPAIVLRPHQKASVWRILQSPNVLLAHVVGAGKTYTMAAAAMELKRLGLARKPLIVVPNHMLGQFSTELLHLYPGANILAAGKDDFSSDRRRELMSRIATNNWDAVIVTHAGFERLPLSARARSDFMDQQLAELEDCIAAQKARAGTGGTRIVKELERAKKRLEARIKTLSAEHRKDDTITFEELGVDRLFVDEAQAFKNLFYVTKMTRVAGLPQTASERAFDMYLKVQHVQRLNGGGGVVFATGTPVTNTMAEMFTMQRYLQPAALRQRHLHHFDGWAGTFGEPVTAMELAPDGAGYRLHTRFARFVNVPELMQLFREVADIQTAEMLKLPVPQLEGGKPTIVSAPCSPELKSFVAHLAKRAEKLKTDRVDPSVDNMLKITGEGRKAALDLRVMRPSSPDHASSKLNQAVREIHSLWTETRAERLTQMVFCDLSTPRVFGDEFSAYTDLRDKLVARGVPPDEIAFIHDHDSDAAKLALFKDVRSGKVRVLMGSTAKMGAGTNAQTKLVALHHLDAPWRPADIEQREGRILRQGNTNASVRIFRYVTEGSFDAYMWQTLEIKARFIAQVMTGHSTARRIEDLDAPVLTYAEVKAIASGNPLVIEKAKVDAEVMRLSRLRAEHAEAQFATRTRLRHTEEDEVRLVARIASLEKDSAVRRETKGDLFTIRLEQRTFVDRTEAGNALVYLLADFKDAHRRGHMDAIEIGQFAGFRLEFRSTVPDRLTLQGATEHHANVTASPAGTIASLEHTARSIGEQLANAMNALVDVRRRRAELAALVGGIFDHEERYRELLRRQSELVEALDITKNQAGAQLSADASGEEAAAEPRSETVGPTVRARTTAAARPQTRARLSA